VAAPIRESLKSLRYSLIAAFAKANNQVRNWSGYLSAIVNLLLSINNEQNLLPYYPIVEVTIRELRICYAVGPNFGLRKSAFPMRENLRRGFQKPNTGGRKRRG
jgi:hypothetical protein